MSWEKTVDAGRDWLVRKSKKLRIGTREGLSDLRAKNKFGGRRDRVQDAIAKGGQRKVHEKTV